MTETLGRKIESYIDNFQEKAVKLNKPEYFTPLTESKPDNIWINRLLPVDDAPESAIFLYYDSPQKNSGDTKYHLDVQQIIDSSFQPKLSIEFVTDLWGNLSSLGKLQLWLDDLLYEYKMDNNTGERAYLKSASKKTTEGKYQQLDNKTYANLLSHPRTQPIKAVDWMNTVFSYVTGVVHQNTKPIGQPIDAKIVAKTPLISTFEK